MALFKIGGFEYELVLTIKDTKEIAKRYVGLSSLGDKLTWNVGGLWGL